MQGLVDFAGEIGNAMAILLPTFCYLMALASFLFAAWGFWMMAHPGNPFHGRPWIPFVSLVLCGAFASFDKVLTMANASAGTSLQVSVGALTSYVAPTVGTVIGTAPGDTVVNVVTLFQAFFQSFGAMACFFAVVAWRSVINGRSNRSQGGCLVQFTFGIMLVNILTITTWLAGVFQATA
ncbi:hypothetical protein [Methylocella tundrae]|uniref:Uncharacterized protein n=1 Tax=Methylocella tundrae TaxID=227605 RepID=A0A4U8Z8Y7_METTU|nr:hypothetical protein [Methylocella tundrae]WPP02816.1 hypothetical protein SIN04_00465 [Methylocella tundrae]VFU17620.1 conserved membrane protein of unknown function [Methylocella tundrae]